MIAVGCPNKCLLIILHVGVWLQVC